jgi:steroid delta-isomerase-like uncharacterized protein
MAMDIEKWVSDETAAWSSQDIKKILSLYTDDCIYEDLAVGKVSNGREELRVFIKGAFIAFPDFKVEIKSFFASPDHVCIENVLTGTHMGNIPGLPPATGKSLSDRGAPICELREGKAIRASDYYDMASVMRQLGLLPSPPQP